jgi:hypothetical protein
MVEGIAVGGEEGDEDSVNEGVEKLDSGDVPILHERGAEGEDEDEERSGDESDAGEEAEENQEADGGFDPRERVGEGGDKRLRQGSAMELLLERCGEVRGPGKEARDAVEEDVHAESGAEEKVSNRGVRVELQGEAS